MIRIGIIMSSETRIKGTIVEMQCMTYLLTCGCIISKPLDDNTPYDFVIDYHGRLFKIQVKSPSIINEDSFGIRTERTRINAKGNYRKSYDEFEVDYFATYYLGMCYLIPKEECNKHKILRFSPTKSGVVEGINWAVEYEADYILEKIINQNALPRFNMTEILNSKKEDVSPDLKRTYNYHWITNEKESQKYYGDINDIPEGFRLGRVM